MFVAQKATHFSSASADINVRVPSHHDREVLTNVDQRWHCITLPTMSQDTASSYAMHCTSTAFLSVHSVLLVLLSHWNIGETFVDSVHLLKHW